MSQYQFDLYDFRGHKVLFTPARSSYLQEPIPEILERYEIRFSDTGGEACELARGIIVNFFGTIFSYEPIELNEFGCLFFEEEKDFKEIGDMMTFDEYIDMMERSMKMEKEMKMTM